MDLGLTGKVVVVTGGAGAIGSAAARCFAAEGAVVIVADKVPVDQDGTERLRHDSGGARHYRHLDLADERSIASFADGVLREFKTVDVLVNNAATFHFGPVTDWDGTLPLERHLRVGLLGPVRLIQEIWRRAPGSKAGCVINVSSVVGHVGEPDAFAYTPVKAAQNG